MLTLYRYCTETLTVLVIMLTLYRYGTRTFNYWKNKGIKHDKPLPFLGNNFRQFFQKATISMVAADVYRRYPEEKVVGFYRGTSPELVIRDPDIIKRILVTDFQHFYARGMAHKTVIEPLMKNLAFADGDLWCLVRQCFTPAFSPGKLKALFPIITRKAKKLQVLTEEFVERDACDVYELIGRYTTEVIGACGFGIDMDCLSVDNSEYRKLAKRIVNRKPRDMIAIVLKTIFPELCKHMTILAPEVEKSMLYLVRTVIKARNFKPSGRNDFIDNLLLIKQNKPILNAESMEHKNDDGTPKVVELKLDEFIMAAQVFIFFSAGFETSSLTASYTLHQLAFNPECLQKVIKEIDRVLEKHDNEITYEAVKDMKYLEMAFYEAMRLYPSVGHLVRCCVSPQYIIPEIGLSINEGVKVIIPTQALHRDEKYFANPEMFDPERFHLDREELNKFVYLPFGKGLRACVGARLGQMQAMAGVAAVLQKYTVSPASSSVRNPPPNPKEFVTESFVGGLPLKIHKRQTPI